MPATLAQRLEDYSMPEPNSGCLLWLRGVTKFGYGWVRANGAARLAHRVSYELANGPIPAGMCILHKCDVPACINPDHLRLGTQIDNIADMRAKGRSSDGRPRPDARGERNGNNKHSEKLMLAVKRADGTYAEIARIYGVSETAVGYVKRGIQWAHLSAPSEKVEAGEAAP